MTIIIAIFSGAICSSGRGIDQRNALLCTDTPYVLAVLQIPLAVHLIVHLGRIGTGPEMKDVLYSTGMLIAPADKGFAVYLLTELLAFQISFFGCLAKVVNQN